MKPVKALVLSGYGLNCDYETVHAFEQAGASARRVHINDVIQQRVQLADFHILAFIGGFSWGDDHGAGVIQAHRLKTHIGDQLLAFVADGKLIIGICNGFQTLVNMGLLPGNERGTVCFDRSVALTANACGNFRDAWVHLAADPESPCVFTKGFDHVAFPVRHGEGQFVTDTATLARLKANHQVVFRYAGPDGTPAGGAFPDNPNGSMDDIAGICDPTGRIFGLMPHPEAYHHPANHPDWFRMREQKKRKGIPGLIEETPGIRLFRNAVEAMAAG
ncbi:MAG: phosphoribosylformylglycinamidine synthase [Deltaproteobacteria bacterium]|nr:MAG: phosphoribosylformylglycinamidine synthase [Deltaproteobacteria bacterium]